MNPKSNYYIPRWQFFTQWLIQLIQNDTEWDDNVFGEHVMQKVEAPWTLQTKVYPTEALGSTIQIATYYYEKYRPATQDLVNIAQWKANKKRQGNLQHPHAKRLPLFYRKQHGKQI